MGTGRASRRWTPWGWHGSVAGATTGCCTSICRRFSTRCRTTCYCGRCVSTPTAGGCYCTLNGGSRLPSNSPMAPWNLGSRDHRRGQSFRPCCQISSCTMRSIGGWQCTIPLYRSNVSPMISSATATARPKRVGCGRCWSSALRRAGCESIRRRRLSSTARMMTDGGSIPPSNSTSWAIPFVHGGRRTGGGSTSSISVQASAIAQQKPSVRPSAAGALIVALTRRLTTWLGCSIPSFGVGSPTMVGTTSRRCTRRYATWISGWRAGPCQSTNA